jgi:polyhydroxyalkanoate synthase subunit PhaC
MLPARMKRPLPRLLPLHLILALGRHPLIPSSASLPTDWSNVSGDSPPWNSNSPHPLRALLRGIERYREIPVPPAPAVMPVRQQWGSTRLFDYRTPSSLPSLPLLVVPSLLNRSSILDLAATHSLLRFLSQGGISLFLLDWGVPGQVEQTFTLDDYITQRLEPALTVLSQDFQQPIRLLGHCMGGLLALALAQRRSRDVAALALLATPWDFHVATTPWQRQTLQSWKKPLEALGKRHALIAPDVLQYLLMGVNPYSVIERFIAFGQKTSAQEKDWLFVRIEEWLNDGVPMSRLVLQQCLDEWYGANAPFRQEWRVTGVPVQPSLLNIPLFIVAALKDSVVPPASSLALCSSAIQTTILQPDAGHIGMVAGRRAEKVLWRPLLQWLSTAV